MKRTLALFFSFLINGFVNAQVLKSVGINGGVTIANQSWHYKSKDFSLNTVNKAGFYGGTTFEFFQSKYFNLLVGLGYCQKGNSWKILSKTSNLPEGDGTYTTIKTTFNYLTLSPMLKAGFETTHIIPYALVGLRMDYQLSVQPEVNYEAIKKDVKKTIWGVNFGAGIEYKLKVVGIFFEGQYHYDFSKVLDTPVTSNNVGLEIKNKAFIITAGIKYYLKKTAETK